MENSLVFYFIPNIGVNFCFTRTKICLPWWFWGSKIGQNAWKLHALRRDLNSIDPLIFNKLATKFQSKSVDIKDVCIHDLIWIKFYAYSEIRDTDSQNIIKSEGYLTVLQIDFAIKDLFWNGWNTQYWSILKEGAEISSCHQESQVRFFGKFLWPYFLSKFRALPTKIRWSVLSIS